jgi:hypothetical protein
MGLYREKERDKKEERFETEKNSFIILSILLICYPLERTIGKKVKGLHCCQFCLVCAYVLIAFWVAVRSAVVHI